MTEVALTLRTAYLAGPMRGHPDLNFPEFHKQAAWLRASGWQVFSPAERDEADPVLNGDFSVGQERGLDYYMQFDLAAVAQADCVICLPGWQTSQGARLETVTAVELGHPVFAIEKRADGGRYLAALDHEYIRNVFYVEGDPEAETVSWEDVKAEAAGPDDESAWYFKQGYEAGAASVTIPEEETISSREADMIADTLSYDPSLSEARKAMPIASGVLDYFPAALLEVAKVSKAGNDKHNPGQELHHARGKSTGHADSLLRHLIDRGKVDEETGQLHSAEVAWRALAMLQQELEDAGAPLARGARLG